MQSRIWCVLLFVVLNTIAMTPAHAGELQLFSRSSQSEGLGFSGPSFGVGFRGGKVWENVVWHTEVFATHAPKNGTSNAVGIGADTTVAFPLLRDRLRLGVGARYRGIKTSLWEKDGFSPTVSVGGEVWRIRYAFPDDSANTIESLQMRFDMKFDGWVVTPEIEAVRFTETFSDTEHSGTRVTILVGRSFNFRSGR